MMSHLERCYADFSPKKKMEKIPALEINRVLEGICQKITNAIFKAVNIVFRGMFRVRYLSEEWREMHHTQRVGAFRFNQRINSTKLSLLRVTDTAQGCKYRKCS